MVPVVSVVVPVHNMADYLPECVDTLVAQTLQEIEIILVNGASTDDTLVVMRDYERRYPDKIVVIDSPIDLGPGGHRNLGIKAAKAEYVGFVDADDWVDPSMFSKMYAKAVETHCDLVHCLMEEDDELGDERLVIQDNLPSDQTLALEGKQLDDTDREVLCLPGGATGGVTQQLYRKAVIVDNDLWFPESMMYEDMHFTKLAPLYINSISFVKEYLYHYRTHMRSITHVRNAPWLMDKARVQCMAIDDIRKRGLGDRIREVVEYGFLFGYWVSTASEWELRCDRGMPVQYMAEIRSGIMQRFPEFRHNRYYVQYTSPRVRHLTSILMLSPRAYVAVNQLFRWKAGAKRGLTAQLRKHPEWDERVRAVYGRRPMTQVGSRYRWR